MRRVGTTTEGMRHSGPAVSLSEHTHFVPRYLYRGPELEHREPASVVLIEHLYEKVEFLPYFPEPREGQVGASPSLIVDNRCSSQGSTLQRPKGLESHTRPRSDSCELSVVMLESLTYMPAMGCSPRRKGWPGTKQDIFRNRRQSLEHRHEL